MTLNILAKQKYAQESANRILVRSKQRSAEYGEVFTPSSLVIEILEQLPDEQWDDGRTFVDPTCGNGQFLSAVAIIKQSLGHTSILDSIYGVDLMQDNVDECRARLLAIAGDTEHNRNCVTQNIVCADGLRYHFRFDGTHPYDDELDNQLMHRLFEF